MGQRAVPARRTPRAALVLWSCLRKGEGSHPKGLMGLPGQTPPRGGEAVLQPAKLSQEDGGEGGQELPPDGPDPTWVRAPRELRTIPCQNGRRN